jgi:RNA polymerase sigma-70 factor (ECF subfamily)
MDFADVARRHAGDVYRFLLYLTGDRALAEDLAGDVMERAFRSRDRFDPGRASQRAWLLAMARSMALDHYRREQRRRRSERARADVDVADASSADGPGISDDLGAALESGLRALSAADREVIALRVVLDLDARSAARLLGISESACSTRLSRALGRLEQEVRAGACA